MPCNCDQDKFCLVRALRGQLPRYPTGAEQIRILGDALLWRLGSLPGLDAYVKDNGRVRLFVRW